MRVGHADADHRGTVGRLLASQKVNCDSMIVLSEGERQQPRQNLRVQKKTVISTPLLKKGMVKLNLHSDSTKSINIALCRDSRGDVFYHCPDQLRSQPPRRAREGRSGVW